MKRITKRLVLLMTLVIALSAMMTVSLSANGGTAPISYTGLQVRTEQDFAGLRAVYTVTEEFRNTPNTVFGVLAASAGAVTDKEDLKVAIASDGTLTNVNAADKKVNMIVVHDTNGLNDPTNTYTNAEKTEFAYTIAYFYESQIPTTLNNDFIFRAFYITGAGTEAANITYVDMSGGTFGGASSIYDVASYWKTTMPTNAAICNIIRKAQTLNTSWEKTDINVTLKNYSSSASNEYQVTFENMQGGIYKVETKGTASSDSFIRLAATASWNSTLSYFKKTKTNGTDAYTPTLWIRLPEGISTFNFYGGNQTITAMRLTKVDDVDFSAENVFFYNPSYDLMQAWGDANLNGVFPTSREPALIAVDNGAGGYNYYPTKASDWDLQNGADTTQTALSEEDLATDAWKNVYIRYGLTSGQAGFHFLRDSANIFSGSRYAAVIIKKGDKIRFVVDAPAAGKYALYAPVGVGKNPTTITVTNKTNDSVANAITISYDSSDDWWQWANRYTAIATEIELQAGKNWLEISTSGAGSHINVGEIAFVRKTHTVTLKDGDTVISEQKVAEGEDAFVSDFLMEDYVALTPDQMTALTGVTADQTITLTKKES